MIRAAGGIANTFAMAGGMPNASAMVRAGAPEHVRQSRRSPALTTFPAILTSSVTHA